MNRPRVLLADDHRMVAEGLKGVLADEFEVMSEISLANACFDLAQTDIAG